MVRVVDGNYDTKLTGRAGGVPPPTDVISFFILNAGWWLVAARNIYKVLFYSQGKQYELYARRVYQGELYGFIELEELIFGEKSALVVDPTEEQLKSEFKGVKKVSIPVHAVIRIDEVEKEGTARITSAEGAENITPFPASLYRNNRDPNPS